MREQRQPRTDVTLTELLDRHLTLVHASDTTHRSSRYTVTKHLRPLLGHLPLAAVTSEVLDLFYAELLRCRDQCRQPQDGHRCRSLAPATVRKIHYLVSSAYRARGPVGLARPQPHLRRRPTTRTAPRTTAPTPRRGRPHPHRRLDRPGPRTAGGWP